MHTTVATSVVAALFVVLGSGCSTVSYSEDFDRQAPVPSSGTWAWKPLTTAQQRSLAEISPFLQRRIERAVERELDGRGFALVSDARPDFLVSPYPILPDRSSRAVSTARARSPVRVSVGIGVGYYFSESKDLLDFGVNWGRPPDSGLDDQYTAELFYRLQVSQNFAITPDVQWLINPALNPDEDQILIFGLRGRLAL